MATVNGSKAESQTSELQLGVWSWFLLFNLGSRSADIFSVCFKSQLEVGCVEYKVKSKWAALHSWLCDIKMLPSFVICSIKCDLWVTTDWAMPKPQPQSCAEGSDHTRRVWALPRWAWLAMAWVQSLEESNTCRKVRGRYTHRGACKGHSGTKLLNLGHLLSSPTAHQLNKKPKAQSYCPTTKDGRSPSMPPAALRSIPEPTWIEWKVNVPHSAWAS